MRWWPSSWHKLRQGGDAVMSEGDPEPGHSGARVVPEDVIAPENQITLPQEHPIINTYKVPGDTGASQRRYWLQFCVMLGLVLPWFGPMVGLFIVSPLIEMGLVESRQFTADTQCFKNEINECDSTSTFEYYFWNITNADAFVAGTAAPDLQEIGPYTFEVKDVRYNIEFSANYTEVAYSFYEYQTFLPSQSCKGCTLSDSFVGINRAYQNALVSLGGSEYPMVLQLEPALLGGVIQNLAAAFAGFGMPNPSGAAVQQWADCSVNGGNSVGGNAQEPNFPELCGYALNVAIPAFTPATLPPASVSMPILQQWIGTTSPSGIDPAALQVTNFFAFYPTAAISAMTGLPEPWAKLFQDYLFYIAKVYGGPAFQNFVLGGPMLSENAGGFVVKRSIHDWLYGWTDPLLAQAAGSTSSPAAKVALTSAFETRTSPVEQFGKNLTDLSWRDSPLIFYRNLTTGRDRGAIPGQILDYNGMTELTWPQGHVKVTGADNGLTYGLYLNKTAPQQMFDPTLYRAIDIQFQGTEPKVQNLSTYEYIIADTSTWSCVTQTLNRTAERQLAAREIPKRIATFDPAIDRCAYPELYNGTWNMTDTYKTQTLVTRAHFFEADPRLAASTGNTFNASYADHGWFYDVERITGLTIKGHRTYQVNHLVGKTDVVYPKVWTKAPATTLWMPSTWLRITFDISHDDAANLISLLKVRWALLVGFVLSLPLIGFLCIPALIIMNCTPWSWENKRTLRLLARSRARDFTNLEADDIVAMMQEAATAAALSRASERKKRGKRDSAASTLSSGSSKPDLSMSRPDLSSLRPNDMIGTAHPEEMANPEEAV